MKYFAPIPAILLLTACTSGSGTADGISIAASTVDASFNGLDFATASSSMADTAGEAALVKIARFVTDEATGQTELVLSTETITFDAADGGNARDYTLTLDGEVLTFSGGTATDSAGQTWSGYGETGGSASRSVSISTYSSRGSGSGFLSEGFFVVGYETDPAEIAALTESASFSGTVHFDGAYTNGSTTTSPAHTFANVTLNADFDSDTIDGNLSGFISGFGDIGGIIAEADIAQNGFTSTISLENCGAGSTCTSNSRIGGAFFGQNGAEISGIIALDATRTNDGTGETEQIQSGGGFVAR